MTHKLSNSFVGKIAHLTTEQEFSDSEISGLKLRVSKNGTKTFYQFYKFDGRRRKYRIGKFGDIGVPAARDVARKIKAEIALGNDPQGERITKRKQVKANRAAKLSVFLEENYFPYADRHHKAPHRTKQIINCNFEGFKNKRMDQITPWILDRWRQDKLKAGIKPSTINRAISTIKAVLSKAEEWGFINKNLLRGYKQLKLDNKGVVRYLSADEEKRLYQALKKRQDKSGIVGQYKDHLEPIISLLINTGARPKEVFTLKWGMVNFVRKDVTYQAAFTKTGQTRTIPLNAKVLEVLKKWKKQSNSDWVFPNETGNGERPHIVSLQKSWTNLRQEAKLVNFRLYDFRHTFASKLVMKGVSIYAVSELLGHTDTKMTQIYAHLSQEHLADAVKVLV